jgi:hypothetical protein
MQKIASGAFIWHTVLNPLTMSISLIVPSALPVTTNYYYYIITEILHIHFNRVYCSFVDLTAHHHFVAPHIVHIQKPIIRPCCNHNIIIPAITINNHLRHRTIMHLLLHHSLAFIDVPESNYPLPVP